MLLKNNFFNDCFSFADYLNEVKLILVGEERAGKSSIADSLSNPLYEFTPKQTTEGIDIIK